ncbi:hypothetical protein ESCAB7627_2003 [Escherichia albertii TW07627]|uniref:Uncharacterized protein n=1 Tax=Escherichia albertii (strain TW07627) TaxID=502347 RepID=A0ABC9NKN2_ESCAT|nr:hypothetical protein ESCAB7627_2003 [Escherichia albertii TW07627]
MATVSGLALCVTHCHCLFSGYSLRSNDNISGAVTLLRNEKYSGVHVSQERPFSVNGFQSL